MSTRKGKSSEALSKEDLETMSEFRYRLRRFLRFSEEVTHAAGVTPLQYQLMLQVRGFHGRSWADCLPDWAARYITRQWH